MVQINGAFVRVRTPPTKAQGGEVRARASWGSVPGGGRPAIIRETYEAHATGLRGYPQGARTKASRHRKETPRPCGLGVRALKAGRAERTFHGIVKVP